MQKGFNDNETGEFADGYIRAVALLRFYFNVTPEEMAGWDEDDFVVNYQMLCYALNFDALRSNADEKNKVYYPL